MTSPARPGFDPSLVTRHPSLLRLLCELAFFGLFLALAVALTWPLAIRLDTAVTDLGDPLLNTWILDWVCHALIHRPLDLFDAPMFHPAVMPLAFSENLIGIALIMLPFHLAGLTALTVYNIAVLLGFAHAAYGGFVLGRVMTRSTVAALVAGVFFGFVSFKFDHLAHLQVIWSGWLPLMLAALIAYWRKPTVLRAAAIFGAFVMNGLTNIHFLLFGSLALALAIIVLAAFDVRRDRRFWSMLGGALVLSALVLLPILLPYRTVAKLYAMERQRHEVEWGSAKLSDWLDTTGRSRVYAPYQDPADPQHEKVLFPGLVPLFLLAAAVLLTPRRTDPALLPDSHAPPAALLRTLDVLIVVLAALLWFAAASERFVITFHERNIVSIRGTDIPFTLFVILIAARLYLRFPAVFGGAEGRSLRTAVATSRFPPSAWVAVTWMVLGVIGSLGLNAFLHTFLYQRVEGFSALRVPARWAIIAYVGMTLWVALGTVTLIRNGSPVRRRIVAAALPLLMVVDVLPMIRWEHVPRHTPPVYRWIDQVRLGPVLELPPEDRWSSHFVYLLHATTHRVPLMHGTSGFQPPVYVAIHKAFEEHRLDAGFTKLLEESGCRLIVVHGDLLAESTPHVTEWLKRETTRGRIAFLRRFDSGPVGDWLFAVTRNVPDVATYRDYANDSQLDRFLDGEATPSAGLFGRHETPAMYERVSQRLTVSGWGLSPHGIRSATALIHNATMRVPMTLYERPDVSSRFPWYPKTPRPGFKVTLPKRPESIPRETDVQIEIVDGSGRTMRLPDIPFDWY